MVQVESARCCSATHKVPVPVPVPVQAQSWHRGPRAVETTPTTTSEIVGWILVWALAPRGRSTRRNVIAFCFVVSRGDYWYWQLGGECGSGVWAVAALGSRRTMWWRAARTAARNGTDAASGAAGAATGSLGRGGNKRRSHGKRRRGWHNHGAPGNKRCSCCCCWCCPWACRRAGHRWCGGCEASSG